MNTPTEARPPFPPFSCEMAVQKVRMAEDAWNNQDPQRIALAYTIDSEWRNRNEFPQGRAQIIEFLTRKWSQELDYRLVKELWAFNNNRIAVRLLTNGIMPITNGLYPMAMKTGSLTIMALCNAATRASMT